MNKTLEDRLGKFAMLLIFGYLTYKQSLALAALIAQRETNPMWELAMISRIAGTLFLIFVVYFTATRLPPRNSAEGIAPRLTAVLGTFLMMGLVVLPSPQIGFELRVISTVLIILGTGLSIYSIRWLGRSFSIMASARDLVTEGPYRLVRHPLYGAELITMVGVVIGAWSSAATIMGLFWLLLQIQRARNEEAVLRATFPEYEDYARRVPMLLPGFAAPVLGRA